MNTVGCEFTEAYNIYRFPLAEQNEADRARRHTNAIKGNLSEVCLLLRREEVRLLKEELTEEYDADKQAALTQVSQQKELEMMAAREGWQRKVEDLLEQVKHTTLKPQCFYLMFPSKNCPF